MCRTVCALHEPAAIFVHGAHEKGFVKVAVKAIFEHAHVDVHDVTVLQLSVIRNTCQDPNIESPYYHCYNSSFDITVTYNLVDRGAYGLRELVVVQRRGIGSTLYSSLVDDAIQLIAGDAHSHCSTSEVQNFSSDAAGLANAFDTMQTSQGSDSERVSGNNAVQTTQLSGGVRFDACVRSLVNLLAE